MMKRCELLAWEWGCQGCKPAGHASMRACEPLPPVHSRSIRIASDYVQDALRKRLKHPMHVHAHVHHHNASALAVPA